MKVNGSGGITITIVEMGGWVQVKPSRLHDLPENVYLLMSRSLARWFNDRPHLRLRFAVPFQDEGRTVEVHAWYDAVLFPPPPEP